MIRSFKYLLIILINMTVLITLFILSYDTFEQTFNQWGLLLEPIKILGFLLLSQKIEPDSKYLIARVFKKDDVIKYLQINTHCS